MTKNGRWLAVAGVVALSACGPAMYRQASGTPVATIPLVNTAGRAVGSVVLGEAPGGTWLSVNVRGIAPGVHGIHIHETGRCDGPAFTTAGGHFNPTTTAHGLQNPRGPHAGDLPALTVQSDSTGQMTWVNTRVVLTDGQSNSLFRQGGTAVVIHAGPDDQRTDPSGNSGARIACGVVQR